MHESETKSLTKHGSSYIKNCPPPSFAVCGGMGDQFQKYVLHCVTLKVSSCVFVLEQEGERLADLAN